MISRPNRPSAENGVHWAPKPVREGPAGSVARRADRYELYQNSVQAPESDVPVIRRAFKQEFDRTPKILREDFCGTSLMCCEWVRAHKENIAHGVDLDPEPIAWGRAHNLSRLKPAQQSRVHLRVGNALEGGTPAADVVVGLNFSYYIFKTRELLRRYFAAAYRNLKQDGLFVIDVEGGWEALGATNEERRERRFVYTWEQESFNAITHDARCSIHYSFPDGSRLKRAFTYDWRIWTMPEVREVLLEAGFERSDVYWEGWDKSGREGNGIFRRTEKVDNCDSWIAYVIAVKRGGR
ncbi:MAG: class I SAM-dependent methyltransferase [Planctomycetota bacterium]